MKKISMRGGLLAMASVAALALAGCAGPGSPKIITGELSKGEKFTIYAHDQSVPDWMLATDKLELNFIVKGDVSDEQLAVVSNAEKACRIYTNTVRPNKLVAVLTNGILYAAVDYPFGGLASQVFSGAKFTDYAYYNGVAGGGGGIANGIVQLGGQTYTFENCGREIFNLFPQHDIRVLQKSPY